MATKKHPLQTNQFLAADGVSIFYRTIQTTAANNPGSARQVMVVQHGFGEHSGRYANLCEALDDLPLVIYLLDARGHGNSGAARGVVRSFEQYVSDLDQMINIALKNEKAERVILMGHSLGALICAKYAQQKERQQKLQALIFSSLALRVKTNLLMKFKKALAPFIAQIAPDLVLSAGLDPRHLSHDEDVVSAYKKDPLVHGKISATLGNYMAHAEENLLPQASQITLPLYFFHGKSDPIADYTGSELFYQNVGSKNKKLNLYENLYHETMNETYAERNKVLKDLTTWIKTIL